MKGDKVLLAIAVIAVIVSVIAAGVTYFSIAHLTTTISGFATSGDTNLTIESSAAINFTNASIDWGVGRVYANASIAHLNSLGVVEGGNWTPVTAGFIVENIGNVNVSLNFSVGKTAAQFIGGNGAEYYWNVSNYEAGACTNSTDDPGPLNLSDWLEATTTPYTFCPIFQFASSADRVRVDFNISIPENAATGAKGDILTATVTVI